MLTLSSSRLLTSILYSGCQPPCMPSLSSCYSWFPNLLVSKKKKPSSQNSRELTCVCMPRFCFQSPQGHITGWGLVEQLGQESIPLFHTTHVIHCRHTRSDSAHRCLREDFSLNHSHLQRVWQPFPTSATNSYQHH